MSWQSALVCWVLKRQFRPETEKPHVDVERARLRAAARVWAPKVPAGWRLRECYRPEDAPLLGEWLEPIGEMAGGGPRMTVLYLHGGGYYFCSPKSHRSLVFQLAVLTGARTFSLAYRLAPEHPFPAALDDALAAYRHLIASGAPPGSVVIAGDSAGGGLALATLVALRDAGDPLPAAALLFSPWTDLAATGATLATNDGADPMFRGAAVARAARFYVGGADPRHPYVSPLYADFTGLPPLLIEGRRERGAARRCAARSRAGACRRRRSRFPDLAEDASCLADLRAVRAGGAPLARTRSGVRAAPRGRARRSTRSIAQ